MPLKERMLSLSTEAQSLKIGMLLFFFSLNREHIAMTRIGGEMLEVVKLPPCRGRGCLYESGPDQTYWDYSNSEYYSQ